MIYSLEKLVVYILSYVYRTFKKVAIKCLIIFNEDTSCNYVNYILNHRIYLILRITEDISYAEVLNNET